MNRKKLGKRNQAYGKAQEYRCMDVLSKIDDVEIVKYYGQRHSKAGDFLVRVGGRQVRFDHKSSRSDTSIRLKKEWVSGLTGINLLRMDKEGVALPAISFNIYRHPSIYVMVSYPTVVYNNYMAYSTKFNSFVMTAGILKDHAPLCINFDGYAVHIYELSRFIERIKNNEQV